MVLLAAFLVLGQSASGQSQQRLILEHRYAALSDAFRTLNFATVKNWIDDNAAADFFLHPKGGSEMNADETIESLKTQFMALKSVSSSKMKVGNMSLHPDRMSCSVKSHLEALTRANGHMVADSITVNVWKLVKGKWKLASMVTTESRTSLNGKVVG